jgi:hypothetical protein
MTTSPSALQSTVVSTRTIYFNLKISPFSLQGVFIIVKIITNRRNCDYFPINIYRREAEEEKRYGDRHNTLITERHLKI